MQAPPGLAGVIVGTTAISHVDGARGRLIYRGHPIDELIDEPFGRVTHLVVTGESGDFDAALCRNAQLSDREREMVLAWPATLHPMHAVQGAAVLLDATGAFTEFGPAAQGLAVAAKLPHVLATLLRRSPVEYPASGDFLARFLAMIDAPDRVRRAFSVIQILQIEHGFNAGTFASRVVASTEAPVQNAIAAGFGALHGRLHGGADQAALEVADRVVDPDRAAAFVDDVLARGGKVMGMGHREYRVVDPRARHVKRLAQMLTQGTPHQRTFDTLAAIERRFSERMAERGKDLYANLEFYKGLVYRVAGLPTNAFTAAFAMARVFGYVAHFIESAADSRIFRPAARYTGPMPERPA